MESRTLDITLQYAKDLNNVNLFSKMDVYAVVSISGGDKNAKQKTKTPVDHDGDANPTWNFPMKFTVDEAALQMNRLSLDFKLVCERALGDKDVGEVHVPLKELIDSKRGADGKQVVSYQVRKPSGKPKGQLTFSYQFGEKTVAAASAPPAVPYGYGAQSGKADSEPVTAYPAGTSAGYPPPGAYPPQAAYAAHGSGSHSPQVAYAAQGSGNYAPPTGYPPAGGAPKPGPEGYPAHPPAGYGYPPPPPGYGYPPPPPPGYGYPPQPGYGYPPPQAAVQPPKKNKFGMGLGAGLLGGALGGLLIGDMVSDAADYDCGGFDGGFDF